MQACNSLLYLNILQHVLSFRFISMLAIHAGQLNSIISVNKTMLVYLQFLIRCPRHIRGEIATKR
jgi:hypothetical protein